MKMSFETTLAFLRDAVQEGDVDDLTNPSARIVAGRVGHMGTGGFDVLMPLTEAEAVDGDGDVEMEE
jgi:DNA-directed RNA polymerase I subunit RPA1